MYIGHMSSLVEKAEVVKAKFQISYAPFVLALHSHFGIALALIVVREQERRSQRQQEQ